jgi:hypothetical protein
MEERMTRMEDLLGRVLERLEAANTRSPHTIEEEAHGRLETAETAIGIDVVNTNSTVSNPSSTSAVVSIFKNTAVGTKLTTPAM